MKTFKEYGGDTVDPHYHAYGGSLLGPSLGQYRPVADLNANKHGNSKGQLLGPKKPRTNEKEVTKSDLDQIEKYADRLFGAVGIDVEFTRHFLDRVNDVRNKMQITSAEITRLFKQSYRKFGKVIRKLGPDAQAVLTDMKTDINMPFVLNLKGGELELVAKTVMRKKDFKTSNPKLAFEEVSEGTYFTRTRSNKSRGQIMKKQLRPKIEPLMKDIGFKRGSYKMEPNASANNLIITVNKSDLDRVKKALKPLGLPNIVQVVSEGRKTVKVGEDALVGEGKPHYAFVSHREVIATGTKQEMLELSDTHKGRVWLTKSNVGDIVEGIGEPNIFSQKNPRIPRKKGQPAGSDKHSDLYTDENPKGTIHGLGFKDVETARASVKKIEGSGKSHAHKIQAAIAMEQRARVMGKKSEAAIYRAYIEKMKKKTKEMQKEDKHGFKCPPDYKFDKKLMACVPKKTRYKTVYAYPAFFGGTKSGDQSGQTQNGQNGNGNGNGNGANGNGGNGNGGNGGGNGG